MNRRWVEQGSSSFWSFCVDYLDGAANGSVSGKPGNPRGKVDDKDVLSPEEFAVFARLRDLRKEIAQAEAVPVYTIFTNEQLAQMVQTKARSKSALEKIALAADRPERLPESLTRRQQAGFACRPPPARDVRVRRHP